jgi:hypothetical protein
VLLSFSLSISCRTGLWMGLDFCSGRSHGAIFCHDDGTKESIKSSRKGCSTMGRLVGKESARTIWTSTG